MTVADGQYPTPKVDDQLETTVIEHPYLIYWKSFFNFFYYLGLIPHRFEFGSNSGEWKIRRNARQKVVCIIGTVLFLDLAHIKYFYNEYHSSEHVTFYLELTNDVALLVYLVGINYTMWGKTEAFLKVFNFVQQRELLQGTNPVNPVLIPHSSWYRIKVWGVSLLPAVFILFAVITQLQNAPDLNLDTFEQFEVLTQHLLFMNTSMKLPAVNFVVCLLTFYFGFVCFMLDCLFTMSALFYKDLVSSFTDEFRSRVRECRNDSDLQSVLESYQTLKQCVMLINDAAGWANLGFFIGIPSFVFEILGVISNVAEVNTLEVIRIFGVGTYITAGALIMASTHTKIGSIYNWLIRGSKYIKTGHQHFHMFLHDIGLNNIALSIAEGCHVTYGFIGSTMGLIVTFMVLLLQFQSPGSSSSVFQMKSSIIAW